MTALAADSGAQGASGWWEFYRHARFAVRRTWQATRSLSSALVATEVIDALVPGLFALTAGMVVGQAKYVFERASQAIQVRSAKCSP